jgi:drug/metabolite transporter (DMT)-like permease
MLAAIWGSSYLFIKIGLRDLSPMVVACARTVLGAAVLVPLALRAGALRRLGSARALWPMLALVALIQVAAPFALISEGEQHISSALAGILVASVPIFTAILAIRYDAEDRSEGLRAVGVLVGIAGVGLLLGLDLGDSSETLIGGLLIVLASLGYAIGGLLVKKRLASLEPIGIAAAVMAMGSVMALPFALLDAPSEAPGLGPLAAVAALGIFGTGVAFAIFYRLLTTVGPSRTFTVTYLAPGFAVIYGAALLDESIGVATMAGLGLILAGSFLAAEGRLPFGSRAVSDLRTRGAGPA